MLHRLHFDLWYLFRPPWDSRVSPPELLEFLGSHAPGQALDVGCGSGTNVITLARHGWIVTGIDFAPRAVRIANRRARAAGVEASFIVGDITKMHPVAGAFDLALDLGCFHGIDDRRAYLSSLRRMLAPAAFWLLYGLVRVEPDRSRPGIDSSDLSLIHEYGFEIRTRKDGTDKSNRHSGWFLFERVR